MAAHSHILSAAGEAPRSARRTASGTPAGRPARLPWWGVVAPVIAFVTLLAVVAGPAHADPAAAGQPLADLLGHVRDLLPQSLANLL
ncbi:hypothetical protein [Streptantibioticus parmotrematis]|uniref:hypothetical protein n=1 Tax=Streptantibioticus parmotrematis TaxID=2873249 RepID=UPI00207BF52F|nr:hypothetical protein [Streptantibioticus parmotrematis]